MAITTNTLKACDLDLGLGGANYHFNATKSDTDLLLVPGSSPERQVVSKAISIDRIDEAVKVTYLNGMTHTFAAGELAAGVAHPMRIIQVWSTGTGASVKVKIWA